MDRRERRALELVLEAFGPDALVQRLDTRPMTPAERLRARLAAEACVEGCTACALHAARGGACERPLVPLWSPHRLPAEGRVAVLVDAPTIEEHRAGQLGRGPLWRVVRQALTDGGIAPERISYLTTVACTPLTQTLRDVARVPPAREHVDACTANVMRSLLAADVQHVLLLGGHATRVWRPDLRLADVAGKWFVWQGKWMVFPAEHPRVMFGGRAHDKEAAEWGESVRRFSRGVCDGVGLEALSTTCIVSGCREPFHAWDDDGVPWCATHLRPARLTRDSRKRKTLDTAQGTLL